MYCSAAASSPSSRVNEDPSLSFTEISVNGKVFSFGIPSARDTTLFPAEYAIFAGISNTKKHLESVDSPVEIELNR